MKINGTDKPLPKKLAFYADGTQLVRLTFAQRLRVLFGFRIVINISIRSQHNPGAFAPEIQVALTKYHELVAAMADKESMIPVGAVVPVLDETLELAVDRLKEQAAKAGNN